MMEMVEPMEAPESFLCRTPGNNPSPFTGSDSEASRAISGSSQVEVEEAASSLQRVSGEMCFKEACDMESEGEMGDISGDEPKVGDMSEEIAAIVAAVVMGIGLLTCAFAKPMVFGSTTSVESPMVVMISLWLCLWALLVGGRTLVFPFGGSLLY